MSLYYCSITGEPAEKPIVSNKSGHVFEKRVIEKYIDANPVCPITGQPLTRDDLVAVQGFLLAFLYLKHTKLII